MKVLHTADWHLGQTFYEYDRREEHFHFLEWLKQQIKQHEIDVLLIAGDVFDSPNPSAESQRVYYRFLREVTSENPSLQIVIIAGNHDSAARLEAPNPLLEDMNIIVRGTVRRNAEGDIDLQHLIVPLYTEGKVTAYCLAVPYLRQGDYPSAENYSKGVQQLYEQLFNKGEREGNSRCRHGTSASHRLGNLGRRPIGTYCYRRLGMCIPPMPLMKPLLIPHWGICIAPNVYPIGRMCVIPELLCLCLLLRRIMHPV